MYFKICDDVYFNYVYSARRLRKLAQTLEGLTYNAGLSYLENLFFHHAADLMSTCTLSFVEDKDTLLEILRYQFNRLVGRKFPKYSHTFSENSVNLAKFSRMFGEVQDAWIQESLFSPCYKTSWLDLEIQGNEELDSGVEESKEQQEVIEFLDAKPGSDVSMATITTDVPKDTTADFANFLKRPVLIESGSWTEGTALNSVIKPWDLFFNDVRIKRKLDNFAYLRCKLKIKFLINASPFYYGSGIVSYQPMGDLFDSARIDTGLNNSDQSIGYSQRPHFWFHAASSEGGEMELPFLYHKDWLRADVRADFQNMGNLTIITPMDLMNANGVVGQSVEYQVYCWAEDVEVCGPTVEVALQGKKDEYGEYDGIVSKPASAFSKAFGTLKKVPVIGKFATATSWGLGAVATVANALGFTNVPVISDVMPFKGLPFGGLASTEVGIPLEKLTLDPKNELTIDNTAIGGSAVDPLLLSDLNTRESYLTKFTWAAVDASGGYLWSTRVNPNFFEAFVAGKALQRTPIAHFSRLFRYWRGGITLKFRIICSKYHRGRLRITWDPIGDQNANPVSSTVAYNRIVDIETETEISITIPYLRDRAWQRVDTSDANVLFSETIPQTYNDLYDNGTLYVRVLNAQTSPVAGADIVVLVSVAGCDDLEYANPAPLSNLVSPYQVQGKIEDATEASDKLFEAGTPDPHSNLIYQGEAVTSLRQLLRRSVLSRTATATGNTTSQYGVMYSVFSRYPLCNGYDPNGISTVLGEISGLNESYNYVYNIPFNHITQCFMGMRGSMIWHINSSAPYSVASMRIRRDDRQLNATYYNSQITGSPASVDERLRDLFNIYYGDSGEMGQALIHQQTQTGLSILAPMYSQYKFIETDPQKRTLGFSVTDTQYDSLHATYLIKPADGQNPFYNVPEYYCSIGTDFNVIQFLNVPTQYLQGNIPSP